MSEFLKEFKNPGKEFRGKPFWAWNGKLNIEELRRQIRIMREMGLGGFFMHARVGLDTPYLSDEWFSCVSACVDEAEKLDMEAWLYDEYRWPSGAAGGLVTKDEQFRMRYLKVEEYSDTENFEWRENIVVAFISRIEKSKAFGVKRLEDDEKPVLSDGEKLVVFSLKIMENSSWYNGYTYLDTLNPEAVEKFVEVTHDAYKKNFSGKFGKVIPGIFTDEPHHALVLLEEGKTSGQLPWTGVLPDFFKKQYGYDIIPHLMEVVYDVNEDGVTQARYHYHDCLATMFVNAFAKTIGDWCEENNLMFTGHVVDEDTLHLQGSAVSNCMRFYEHMQAPGMDLLTEHWRIYNVAKQVSSVAHQTGRKWRLTETYGCTGWDFPFSGHKALGDWQVALGINLRCHHLSWYTMEGEAKRDYPASIFYQNPWYDAYSKIEDYFGRINSVMTKGNEVRNILVIHPIESIWLKAKKDWHLRVGNRWATSDEAEKIDRDFVKLTDKLLQENLDFDFGDEEMLGRLGEVNKNGKISLQLGLAEYSVVVVPELITMRKSTLEILREFKNAGGEVIFVGQPAGYVEAKSSNEVKDFSTTCFKSDGIDDNLVSFVEKKGRSVSIVDKDNRQIKQVLYLLREDSNGFYLFICNTGHDLDGDILQECFVHERNDVFPEIIIKGFKGCCGLPVELDPDTGNIFDVQHQNDDQEGIIINSSLPELGSRLFYIPKDLENNISSEKRQLCNTVNSYELDILQADIIASVVGPQKLVQ